MCLQACLVHLLETALMAPQVTAQLRRRIVLTQLTLLCPELPRTPAQCGAATHLTVPAKHRAKEAEVQSKKWSRMGFVSSWKKEDISDTVKGTRSRSPRLLFCIFQMTSVYFMGTTFEVIVVRAVPESLQKTLFWPQ